MKKIVLLGSFMLCTFLIGCKKSAPDTPATIAPIANAGGDQQISISGVDSTILSGSGSAPPGHTISSYSWTKVSGPAQYTIVSPTSATTVVKNLAQNKTYKFELKITDDEGRVAKDTVTVKVNLLPNQAPIAKAGNDTAISIPPASFMLDGSASSDPDGKIASFQWAVVSAPVPNDHLIQHPDSAKTLVQNLQLGTYQFSLTVTDSAGAISQDNIIIQVSTPPEANAGVDGTVFQPDDALLDGSLSTSNNIGTHYSWSKIAGPASFNISNPAQVQTLVTGLVLGDYQFELVVTDNAGLVSKDTVTITVKPTRPLLSVQLVPFKSLSAVSQIHYSAFAGNKAVFVGDGQHVDIYDLGSQTWSEASLHEGRFGGVAIATLGNKVFIAGGNISSTDYTPTTTVDIYDAGANTWSTAQLSRARGDLAATSVGDEVIFAGGYNPYDASYNTVDIYNNTTNTWSTSSLSDSKFALAATALGSKAIFGGGFFSKHVDIFDNNAQSWKTDSLVQARGNLSAVSLNGKAYFAGGETGSSLSNVVDIYDGNTQTWSTDFLSRPKSGFSSATLGNRIVFFANAGTRVDILDQSSNTWYTAELSQPLYGATIVSVGEELYAASGNQVWKLVF